jgi:hypothetical protein
VLHYANGTEELHGIPMVLWDGDRYRVCGNPY